MYNNDSDGIEGKEREKRRKGEGKEREKRRKREKRERKEKRKEGGVVM